MLSADLQQVSTVAGDGEEGHRTALRRRRSSTALRASRCCPTVACWWRTSNHRIRMLSADLQQVSTVAGDGTRVHRDGAAVQARSRMPQGLALLPGGRVLVADPDRIRLLSGFVHMPTPRQHNVAAPSASRKKSRKNVAPQVRANLRRRHAHDVFSSLLRRAPHSGTARVARPDSAHATRRPALSTRARVGHPTHAASWRRRRDGVQETA